MARTIILTQVIAVALATTALHLAPAAAEAQAAASNHYSHVGIGVSDVDRSLPFYKALGFRVWLDRQEQSGPVLDVRAKGSAPTRRVVYLRTAADNPVQFLSLSHRDGIQGAPLRDEIGINHVSLWVSDLDAVMRAAIAAGGRRVSGPAVVDGLGVIPSGTMCDSAGIPLKAEAGFADRTGGVRHGSDCASSGLRRH